MGQISRKDGGYWLMERVGREKHLKTELDWVCVCGRCMAALQQAIGCRVVSRGRRWMGR